MSCAMGRASEGSRADHDFRTVAYSAVSARLPLFAQSSHATVVAAIGVTQPPRWRSCGGCSSAQKKVGASRIRARSRRGLADYQQVGLSTKTSAQPWQTRHPLPPNPHLRRAVSRRRRLCKQASSSRPVRRRAAAHKRRPAVIWRADLSFRVPASDNSGRPRRAQGASHCRPRGTVGQVAGLRWLRLCRVTQRSATASRA
jgi:hypothetical protein